MKYKRNGRFLHSIDGTWTIEKRYNTGVYSIYNRKNHEYLKDSNSVAILSFKCLKSAKSYIESTYENI